METGESCEEGGEGRGGEWEGELVRREGSPSMGPAYLLLFLSETFPMIYFDFYHLQILFYPVVLPFIPHPSAEC